MTFPVTLEKGGVETKCFHAPDLKGWLDGGWKVKTIKQETPKNGGDLSSLSKEALVSIAERKGITIKSGMTKEDLVAAIQK